jgi:hypothetical protein
MIVSGQGTESCSHLQIYYYRVLVAWLPEVKYTSARNLVDTHSKMYRCPCIDQCDKGAHHRLGSASRWGNKVFKQGSFELVEKSESRMGCIRFSPIRQTSQPGSGDMVGDSLRLSKEV